jgi:PAS domain S-box-containing protein
MEPPPDHPQGQDTELERLRTELREAQDILDAIRSGQVDALVLSKPEGRSVLTLQGTEHPYRLTVEAMSEGAVTLAADGTLLFCNPRFLEMTKTTREQALGMDFRDFLGPKDRGTIDRLAQSQTAGIARIRLGLRARDGSERPVYLTARELRTEALRCFVLVVTDLSEIARGEEALRQSEARSRALIEGTSDIIAVCATDGTLRYVSPAVMAVGGYEPQALIGTPFQALLHPDDLPLAARALQDIVLHPDFIQHFEARYRHKNGTWVVLESLSRNLTADPAVGGIVVTLRDVTASGSNRPSAIVRSGCRPRPRRWTGSLPHRRWPAAMWNRWRARSPSGRRRPRVSSAPMSGCSTRRKPSCTALTCMRPAPASTRPAWCWRKNSSVTNSTRSRRRPM